MSNHLKRTFSTSSQKSEDNGSTSKRHNDDGTRPARNHDSRWEPVVEHNNKVPTNSQEKRSLKETAASIDHKNKELTEWIATRLQEHSWNTSNKELFRGKLSSYQGVQINGHEKNLADVLVKDFGGAARQKLPDDIKKDLVTAVQAYLKNNEDVLRYFKRSRTAPP